MKKQWFLFIGGPLHAVMHEVEQAPRTSITMTEAGPTLGDPKAVYPDVLTILEYATNYRLRTVNHIDNRTGTTYELKLYVWQDITDPNEASLHMGDAVAHQYFLEHGTVIESARPGLHASHIIIPGR